MDYQFLWDMIRWSCHSCDEGGWLLSAMWGQVVYNKAYLQMCIHCTVSTSVARYVSIQGDSMLYMYVIMLFISGEEENWEGNGSSVHWANKGGRPLVLVCVSLVWRDTYTSYIPTSRTFMLVSPIFTSVVTLSLAELQCGAGVPVDLLLPCSATAGLTSCKQPFWWCVAYINMQHNDLIGTWSYNEVYMQSVRHISTLCHNVLCTCTTM